MALTLGDNFSYQGAKPLDARLKYDTVAAMKAVADSTMYEGCIAYCSGTDKTYQWKSGNTVDETTGKWRELSSGGGGGGTTYTAGDGIDISEDVISTEQSESGWLDEVVDKYPQAGELVSIVNAFNRGDLYSESEKMIGQWIDGKPLYQKTFSGTVESKTNYTAHDLGVVGGIDTIVNVSGIMDNNKPMIAVSNDAFTASIAFYIYPNDFSTASKRNTYECFAKPDANQTYVGHTFVFHLQYTKASDSAIAIGSENEYSTDEKIIGTWVDGKPLYQKTYITSTPSSSDVVTNLFSVSDLNIDTPVKMRAFTLGTWNDINYCQEIPYIEDSNSNSYVYVGGGTAESKYLLFTSTHNIVCKCGNSRTNVPLYITLQYTKTT